MVELKLGTQDNDVLLWQTFLRGRNPYSSVEITGKFDDQTLLETKEFQSLCSIVETGIVDELTLQKATTNYGFIGFAAFDLNTEQLKTISLEEKHKLFGKFSYVSVPIPGNVENIKITDNWVKDNITTVNIPQLIGKQGCKNGNVLLHKKCSKQVVEFFELLEKEKLTSKILTFDGSWVPRFVRGSKTYLSNHAWGTAFDLNASYNPLGVVPKQVGQKGSVREFVEIANKCGLYWGGNYKSRPDGMHFEIVKLL